MTRLPFVILALVPMALAACASEPGPASTDISVTTAPTDDDGEEDDQIAPPTAAAEAFEAEHAAATDVQWTMEEGGYEASFTEGGTPMSIVYTADGVAGAVETEIAIADLPPAVAAALDRGHPGQRVTEAARIVDGGTTTYEAEVTVQGVSRDLIYHEDGTLADTIQDEGG